MNNAFHYLKGFETDRLIIRKLFKRDIPVWGRFFLDTSCFDFIGLTDDKLPCEHSEEWMQRQFRRYRDGEYGLMALVEKETLNLVGQCGLINMNVTNQDELEIGYHIIEEYRGNGYASEAAKAFLDLAFTNRLAKSMITVININNIYSMRVSEKLGLKRMEEITCLNRASYVYRISRSEWEASRP